MAKKAKKIAVYLTPEQIKEAYEQLIRTEHEDWFYEPKVAEGLLRRGRKARAEVREDKTANWEDLKKKLEP